MTPSKEILNLSEPLKYDLTDSTLIQRQVDIAKSFGIYGFAVYYYWFSVNSITNRHLIMENCFNQFFNGSVRIGSNFKVFLFGQTKIGVIMRHLIQMKRYIIYMTLRISKQI